MDDLISRQAVLDKMKERDEELNCLTVKDIKDLPSAEKTGHWIEERTYMECPNCHDIWHYEENQTERFKFCPICGKRIK